MEMTATMKKMGAESESPINGMSIIGSTRYKANIINSITVIRENSPFNKLFLTVSNSYFADGDDEIINPC